jgi:Tol biopolymer transport system component
MLGDTPYGLGGAWNRDQEILFNLNHNAGLHRVSAEGGKVTEVTTVDPARQEFSHRWPCFLPDGRHFLFFVTSPQPDVAGIYLGSLDGGEKKRLFSADSNAIFAQDIAGDGYLLFVREGMLLAQPFDLAARNIRGEPFRLADQVQVNSNNKGSFSISDNGVLALDASSPTEDRQLAWFDRTGKPLGLVGSPGIYQSFRLSPDEKRLAVQRLDRQAKTPDIWLLDLSRGTDSRFTFDSAGDHTPIWSPDGKHVAWTSTRDGDPKIFQKPSSGAGQDEPFVIQASTKLVTDWSGDGKYIIFMVDDPKTKADLWMLTLETDRKASPWAQTQFNERDGRFSPDSKWVAYVSDGSGRNEVYVRAISPSGGKWQISTNGGDFPRWGRDGKYLFYVAADQKLMAVEVKSGASFEAGAQEARFDMRGIRAVGGNYAVTDDGQRFLILTNVEETRASPFSVVINWTAELKRRKIDLREGPLGPP